MVQGIILGVGLFFGFLFGALSTAAWRFIKNWGATRIIMIHPGTSEVREKYLKLNSKHPLVRVFGRPAYSFLKGNYRHRDGSGNPVFFLNAANGGPIRIENNPDVLRKLAECEAMTPVWPTPYDCADVYQDIRSQKVARAAEDEGQDYAKIAAILIGLGLLLLLGVIGMVFMIMQRVNAA